MKSLDVRGTMKLKSFLVAIGVCCLLTLGCSDDGSSGSGTEAGSGGDGGNANMGGEAGSGGAAGSGGSGAGGSGATGGSGTGGTGGGTPAPNLSGTCEKPEEFVIGEISTGSTRGAGSNVVGSSCGNGGISPEAVFSFIADRDATVCLTTERSAYDTVLFVRADSCTDASTEVACNDTDREYTGGDQSVVEFEITTGTEYFVIVDGFGSIGDFVLSGSYGTCAETRPETCNDAYPCDEGLDCESGRCIRRCEMDTNCPDPRSVCRDQICVAVDCRVDAHCGNDGFCIENKCLECRTSDDCAGDDLCLCLLYTSPSPRD